MGCFEGCRESRKLYVLLLPVLSLAILVSLGCWGTWQAAASEHARRLCEGTTPVHVAWRAPVMAMVALGAVVTSAMLAWAMTSRASALTRLERLEKWSHSQRQAMSNVSDQNRQEDTDDARVYASIADMVLNVVGDVLAGRPAGMREAEAIRSALLARHDVYAQRDLAPGLEQHIGELDPEVARNLVRLLGAPNHPLASSYHSVLLDTAGTLFTNGTTGAEGHGTQQPLTGSATQAGSTTATGATGTSLGNTDNSSTLPTSSSFEARPSLLSLNGPRTESMAVRGANAQGVLNALGRRITSAQGTAANMTADSLKHSPYKPQRAAPAASSRVSLELLPEAPERETPVAGCNTLTFNGTWHEVQRLSAHSISTDVQRPTFHAGGVFPNMRSALRVLITDNALELQALHLAASPEPQPPPTLGQAQLDPVCTFKHPDEEPTHPATIGGASELKGNAAGVDATAQDRPAAAVPAPVLECEDEAMFGSWGDQTPRARAPALSAMDTRNTDMAGSSGALALAGKSAVCSGSQLPHAARTLSHSANLTITTEHQAAPDTEDSLLATDLEAPVPRELHQVHMSASAAGVAYPGSPSGGAAGWPSSQQAFSRAGSRQGLLAVPTHLLGGGGGLVIGGTASFIAAQASQNAAVMEAVVSARASMDSPTCLRHHSSASHLTHQPSPLQRASGECSMPWAAQQGTGSDDDDEQLLAELHRSTDTAAHRQAPRLLPTPGSAAHGSRAVVQLVPARTAGGMHFDVVAHGERAPLRVAGAEQGQQGLHVPASGSRWAFITPDESAAGGSRMMLDVSNGQSAALVVSAGGEAFEGGARPRQHAVSASGAVGEICAEDNDIVPELRQGSASILVGQRMRNAPTSLSVGAQPSPFPTSPNSSTNPDYSTLIPVSDSGSMMNMAGNTGSAHPHTMGQPVLNMSNSNHNSAAAAGLEGTHTLVALDSGFTLMGAARGSNPSVFGSAGPPTPGFVSMAQADLGHDCLDSVVPEDLMSGGTSHTALHSTARRSADNRGSLEGIVFVGHSASCLQRVSTAASPRIVQRSSACNTIASHRSSLLMGTASNNPETWATRSTVGLPTPGISEQLAFLGHAGSSVSGPFARQDHSAATLPPEPPLIAMDDVEAHLCRAASSWTFDSFQLNDATAGHPLSCLAYFLLQSTGLVGLLKLDPLKLARFLRAVEASYRDNPYHNRIHAADVLQTMHMLMTAGGLAGRHITPLQHLAGYLAAIVHDLEHVGLTNDFLVSTQDTLATIYNDASPMENHHLAAAFGLLKRPGCSFLSELPKQDIDALRRTIIGLVLGTDMKQHFGLVSTFSTLHKVSSAAGVPAALSTAAPTPAPTTYLAIAQAELQQVLTSQPRSRSLRTAAHLGMSGRFSRVDPAGEAASRMSCTSSMLPPSRNLSSARYYRPGGGSSGQLMMGRGASHSQVVELPLARALQEAGLRGRLSLNAPSDPGAPASSAMQNELQAPSQQTGLYHPRDLINQFLLSIGARSDNDSWQGHSRMGTTELGLGDAVPSHARSSVDPASHGKSTSSSIFGSVSVKSLMDRGRAARVEPGSGSPSNSMAHGSDHAPNVGAHMLRVGSHTVRTSPLAPTPAGPTQITGPGDPGVNQALRQTHSGFPNRGAQAGQSVLGEASLTDKAAAAASLGPGDWEQSQPTGIHAATRAVESKQSRTRSLDLHPGARSRLSGTQPTSSQLQSSPNAPDEPGPSSAFHKPRVSPLQYELKRRQLVAQPPAALMTATSPFAVAKNLSDPRTSSSRVTPSTPTSPQHARWEPPPPKDEGEALLLMQVALKCADLGHLAEELPVHCAWVGRLEEELFRQGDREKALGVSVSPLFDRDKPGITKSQVGFFQFVVIPLFWSYISVFGAARPMWHTLCANYAHWRGVEAATKVQETAKKQPPSNEQEHA